MSLLILCQSPIDSRFLLVSFANVKEGSWLIRLVVRRLGREKKQRENNTRKRWDTMMTSGAKVRSK